MGFLLLGVESMENALLYSPTVSIVDLWRQGE